MPFDRRNDRNRRSRSLPTRFYWPVILCWVVLAACGNGPTLPGPAEITLHIPPSLTLTAPSESIIDSHIVTLTAIPPLPSPTIEASASLTATCPPPTLTPEASASPTATLTYASQSLLGKSTLGWPIEIDRFGKGPRRLVVVGGIHGGYEWNTILLAYQLIDHFTQNPQDLPEEVTLFIIPVLNPDGQVKVVGHPGRFTPEEVNLTALPGRPNGGGVDLNRNWDCDWQPTAVWRNRVVDPGETPFSEVETQLLRDFLSDPPPEAVIFLHSAADGIFAGGCGERYAPSDDLAEIYAKGSGYPFKESFMAYVVTGAAVDWLARIGVPAIEVELVNHRDLDVEQNLGGILAVLQYLQE